MLSFSLFSQWCNSRLRLFQLFLYFFKSEFLYVGFVNTDTDIGSFGFVDTNTGCFVFVDINIGSFGFVNIDTFIN